MGTYHPLHPSQTKPRPLLFCYRVVLEEMEAGETTGLCNRLYSFFDRHFACQGAKLVTLGRRRRRSSWGDPQGGAAAAREPRWVEGDAAGGDFHPVATVPVGDAPGSPGASAEWGGEAGIGRNVSIGDKKAVRRAPSNINERSDEFIRSRKEAIRSETSIRRRPPGSR